MKAILDTHSFLWWVNDDSRLSTSAREVIADSTNEILFSAASAWEIVIKLRLGRLELTDNPQKFIPEQLALNRFSVLGITLIHSLEVYNLDLHHRDPFDRIIIAQSIVEKTRVIGCNAKFSQYGVDLIW